MQADWPEQVTFKPPRHPRHPSSRRVIVCVSGVVARGGNAVCPVVSCSTLPGLLPLQSRQQSLEALQPGLHCPSLGAAVLSAWAPALLGQLLGPELHAGAGLAGDRGIFGSLPGSGLRAVHLHLQLRHVLLQSLDLPARTGPLVRSEGAGQNRVPDQL